MKIADIKKTILLPEYPGLGEISSDFDKLSERHRINSINWSNFKYSPDASFSIGYSDYEIFLKYYINENYFKAEMTRTNQMVCEDSCVEFFVSPEEDGIYYNLEFNAIGTCLMGSGTSRQGNHLVAPDLISKIRILTSAGKSPIEERAELFGWTITVAIPVEVFFRHKVQPLKGKTMRANFYKCGDKLKVPHYLTWNPIGTQNPDFHQPEFFGLLKFV
jgi:hypothetical protein